MGDRSRMKTKILIIVLAIGLCGCDARTQYQQWEEKQYDLKMLGIEYVPMYFKIQRNDRFSDSPINIHIRIRNFSKYLVVRGDFATGYFLVDSLEYIYTNIDEPHFHPSLDSTNWR